MQNHAIQYESPILMKGQLINIRLEAVTDAEQAAAAARVRREVFGTEWSADVWGTSSDHSSRANHLIARVLPENKVIATVTLLDTTANETMHEKYELVFDRSDRVARYTHMAVVKPYHGLKLPLYMLLEAHRLYVVPGGFAYTWLTFPSNRSASSTFCRLLHFSPTSRVLEGEQGPCRVLLRREGTADARFADMKVHCFLDAVRPERLRIIPILQRSTPLESELGSPEYSTNTRRASAGLVQEDEWVAQ
jgi:hypothetical protein